MTDTHFRHRILSFGSSLVLLGAALAGCIGTQDATAEGALYVKDALTDEVTAVHVTFVAAEYLPADAEEWVNVFAGERTIELLSLSAPLAREKLADIKIPPGEYIGLRIAVTSVETVDHEGERVALAVLGNVVTLARPFSVHANGSTDLVVDFDLEEGVDVENGTYAPFVRDVRSSREDADGDGVVDIEDADEIEREAPAQEHAMDQRGVFGLCAAWSASRMGHAEGEAENSTAFVWLREQGDAGNQTVDDYCTAQERPIPSQARGILRMIGAPVAIRGEPEDIPRGRPAGIPTAASAWASDGEPGQNKTWEGAREGNDSGAEAPWSAEHQPYGGDRSTGADPASEQPARQAPADGYAIPDAGDAGPPANSTQETPSSGGNETTTQEAPQSNHSAGAGQTTPTRSGP